MNLETGLGSDARGILEHAREVAIAAGGEAGDLAHAAMVALERASATAPASSPAVAASRTTVKPCGTCSTSATRIGPASWPSANAEVMAAMTGLAAAP